MDLQCLHHNYILNTVRYVFLQTTSWWANHHAQWFSMAQTFLPSNNHSITRGWQCLSYSGSLLLLGDQSWSNLGHGKICQHPKNKWPSHVTCCNIYIYAAWYGCEDLPDPLIRCGLTSRKSRNYAARSAQPVDTVLLWISHDKSGDINDTQSTFGIFIWSPVDICKENLGDVPLPA